MIRNSTRIKRLQKLHDFLIELPEHKFYYGEYVDKCNWDDNCGTVCCAMGWMPEVDPKNWKWGDNGFIPNLKKGSSTFIRPDARRYFGIGASLYNHLFMPNFQTTRYYDGKRLEASSSPKEVASNMAIVIQMLVFNDISNYDLY